MRTIIAAAALLATGLAHAAEYDVTQKENKFDAKVLRIKQGDSVNFRNDDPHFHNVFSLSDTQAFDLGSYPKGQSRKVTFAKEGTVDVECAIHPDMKLKVEVTK
jgi:plastocyanin